MTNIFFIGGFVTTTFYCYFKRLYVIRGALKYLHVLLEKSKETDHLKLTALIYLYIRTKLTSQVFKQANNLNNEALLKYLKSKTETANHRLFLQYRHLAGSLGEWQSMTHFALRDVSSGADAPARCDPPPTSPSCASSSSFAWHDRSPACSNLLLPAYLSLHLRTSVLLVHSQSAP